MSDKFLFYKQLAVSFGIKIIIGLLIIFIGKFLSKRVSVVVSKGLKKAKADDMLAGFIGDLTYYALFIVSIVIALNTIGIKTTSLVAIIGAATLAVGLSLQSNLSNFGSGVLILFTRPFKVGDFVEAGGVAGIVEKISIFNTLLKTPDNRSIIMPNSKIVGNEIINYSARDIRRIDLVVRVGYKEDLKIVKTVLKKILDEDERILKEPEYFIGVSELADNSINFVVRPWVKSSDYWQTRCDLLEKIKTRFDKEGISIPYPQMDVHLKNGKSF
ncbi:mechanosensitive ion channel [Deferribacter autotrophicus]|uniref:Mechanosensitive ion channel n=1 Tax=Deferribacter autotrophicus TaxID=500465 RepID=A0A5A8F630_9BACT|nr:mechanosensitive ion channel domain-containing protein [Deferribacter autotrophicus]KAA0257323.1 mechanosensitive ion channel [Deferribacter autotrophicus]